MGRRVTPAIERLLSKIDRTNGDDACWPWLGFIKPGGYGYFRGDGGVPMQAHRAAYLLLRGPIPDGATIDHWCRVRHCCNPRHMQPTSRRVNSQRRSTGLCQQGHLMNGTRSDGRRYCKHCGATRERQRRALQRQNA